MKTTLQICLVSLLGLALSISAEVGKPAPEFTIKDTKGQQHSLADFKDKVVVLEWINHECPFVKKHYSGKNMQTLQAKYTAKGVVWLSVNSSAEGKQGYLEATKLGEAVEAAGSKATATLVDTNGIMGKAFAAKVTPHLMILSKDGLLAYSGAIDSKRSTDSKDIASSEPIFANALDAVLAGTSVPNAKNEPYGCGVKY